MNFVKGQSYKLVECRGGLAIIAPGDALKQTEVQELCVADLPSLIEYLGRYLYEREAGKNIRDSHRVALRGARVLIPGSLDVMGEG